MRSERRCDSCAWRSAARTNTGSQRTVRAFRDGERRPRAEAPDSDAAHRPKRERWSLEESPEHRGLGFDDRRAIGSIATATRYCRTYIREDIRHPEVSNSCMGLRPTVSVTVPQQLHAMRLHFEYRSIYAVKFKLMDWVRDLEAMTEDSTTATGGDACGSTTCYCPVSGVMETLARKYAIQLVCVVGAHGTVRFSDFEAHLPTASTSTLSTRLEELVEQGLFDRTQYDEIPPRVEYDLTEDGAELCERLDPLVEWVRGRS